MHPMRQPGAMEWAEHLKGLPGAVLKRSGRYRVRRPDPRQFDAVRTQRLRNALISKSPVRAEVGADTYRLNVVDLRESRNNSNGVAAQDAKAVPTCIAQVMIECVQRRHQPFTPSAPSRREKCRVEHKERQYRFTVVDCRAQGRIVDQSEIPPYPPDRSVFFRAHRLILPRASWVFRERRKSQPASRFLARCASGDNRRDVSDLIDTTEMYLRTIYELEEEGIVPLRARIAERLHQSGPTVSQTVARMERDNLVHVLGDRHLELTDEGRMRATRVMRKHRLAERLLIDVIGLDWEKVHDEACRWEHVISEDVERRLVDLLNTPTMSPYGNPIPGLQELGVSAATEPFRDGNEQLQDVVSRSTSPIRVVIERMSEEIQKDVEMMGTLREAGIQPGAEVRAELGGLGVRLTADGWPSCEIDREASTHLFVSRV
jgi:DtxR family transcriptional regulator, Mn-dependent transcriptional regulator